MNTSDFWTYMHDLSGGYETMEIDGFCLILTDYDLTIMDDMHRIVTIEKF